MAESKTRVANNSLRLKLERLSAYEEHAKITGKVLLPHEGFPRENNGDWVILEENGERFGTVTFKSRAKRGETWNAPDPEGQSRARLLVRAVNSHQDLLDALNKAIAYLANPQAFDTDELGKDWWKLKTKAERPAK